MSGLVSPAEAAIGLASTGPALSNGNRTPIEIVNARIDGSSEIRLYFRWKRPIPHGLGDSWNKREIA